MEEEGVLGGVMEFFVSTRYYGFDIGPFFPFSSTFLAILACLHITAFVFCLHMCLLGEAERGLGGSLVTVDINSHSGLVELENRNIN